MVESEKRDWSHALGIYAHPRVAAMLFLGFSAGLPFALTAATLTAWLTRAGVNRSDIGLFALVGTFYALKFAWAPLIDQLKIPLLTRIMGRRRSWMLTAQIGVAAALVAMSTTDPGTQLGLMAWFAVLVAFCSATQDIAVDAWRIEAVEQDLQGAMAASSRIVGARSTRRTCGSTTRGETVESCGALMIRGTSSVASYRSRNQ